MLETGNAYSPAVKPRLDDSPTGFDESNPYIQEASK
jgi:hypothetical protein